MATADRLSAAERRDAIVQAAQPLFASRGFDAVTTRDVADAAKVSEALLYRHFESKAAIYDAVQQLCATRIMENARQIETLPDSASTLVFAVHLMMRDIELVAARDGREQDIPRLILRSLLTDGEFAKKFIKFAAEHWIAKLERCVRAGIEEGAIEEPYDHAFSGFWLSHHLATALVFYRLPGNDVVDYGVSDPQKLFDLSVRFALRGLGMTNAAIARYYQPQAFALLRG